MMKRLYWIARAAWYMRRLFGWWSPRDLHHAWYIASVCWDSEIEFDGVPGCPYDAIDEEISCWND